ncbi:MAG: trypsin-like peptidase domain-containing protein [Alphaproteobacteria bacterium]|nr:trypsin-like peptidase domain-containing protein [Alphaproteobacteria bacterium]MCK5623485.1 trypsin-like peptidase domain-containing protein [Alphaproteobacteria bacterium]
MPATPNDIRPLAVFAALGLVLSLAGCVATGNAGHENLPSLSFASQAEAASFGPAARQVAQTFVTVTLISPPDAGRRTMREPAYAPVIQSASGWVADSRGYIVTAAHIARDVRYGTIVRNLQGQEYPARIVAVAADRELALLQTEFPMDGAPAVFAPPHGPRPGDPVFAVGAPDGRPGVVAAGRVMDPEFAPDIRYGRYRMPRAIRLAVNVSPGYSGGPLFDRHGRLVGMIAGFLIASDGTGRGVGFAIPADDIREWLARTIR